MNIKIKCEATVGQEQLLKTVCRSWLGVCASALSVRRCFQTTGTIQYSTASVLGTFQLLPQSTYSPSTRQTVSKVHVSCSCWHCECNQNEISERHVVHWGALQSPVTLRETLELFRYKRACRVLLSP